MKLTPQQQALFDAAQPRRLRIKRMHDAGLTFVEIARRLKISQSRAHQLYRRLSRIQPKEQP
ncbi:MAG: sigma factor-like helix-turn-helix DNA-binding protein [Terriglobales bacterium]